MKLRKLFSGIILALLLTGMIPVAFNVSSVRAAAPVWNVPIYILANGTVSPSSAPIQHNGNTYTLTGNVTTNTTGIIVQKSNTTVDGAGYTVKGNGSGYGLNLTFINHMTIRNTRIANFSFGISLVSSSNNTISGNYITEDVMYGIYLYGSSNYDTVSGNNVTYNKEGGIYIWNGCDYDNVSGNNVANNNLGGIYFEYSSSNTVSGNNVTNNTYGIILESSPDNTVSGNNAANNGVGMSLELSSRNSVSGNNITSNHGYGIILQSSSKSTVSSNNIRANNLTGITLYGSSNNTLSGNNIKANNYYGIVLGYSSGYNFISGNSITANKMFGIWLNSSSYNSVSGNNIANSSYGIWLGSSSNDGFSGNNIANNYFATLLSSSSNDTISGNNITANKYYGIFLSNSSSNMISVNNVANNICGIALTNSSNSNGISGNNVTNNNLGIVIGSSSSSSYPSHNTIFHNNFVTNTIQVVSTNSTDIWDNGYPSGGNYWGDYTGVDVKNGLYQNQTGSDGIGDTPYVINATLVTPDMDRYPLMGTFNSYLILSRVPRLNNVTVISNSTITGFIYPISPDNPKIRFLMFNVTGKEGSAGFCRVSIPTAIMNSTYQVSVNGTEVPYTLLPCSNANVSYLYFTYKHSTEQVIILREFPSLLIMPLTMIATLLAVAICRRKRLQLT